VKQVCREGFLGLHGFGMRLHRGIYALKAQGRLQKDVRDHHSSRRKRKSYNTESVDKRIGSFIFKIAHCRRFGIKRGFCPVCNLWDESANCMQTVMILKVTFC
jgi:hypothetical protein